MDYEFDETYDDANRACPYCGHEYQPESEDYTDEPRAEECDECGKSFYARDDFSVTHIATPDCELNGETHDWQPVQLRDGTRHPFCTTCGKCQPVSYND